MISLRVVRADALTFESDVLVLKHAQGWFGLDEVVGQRLLAAGEDIARLSPAPGEAVCVDSRGLVAAPSILVLGVVPLRFFGYEEIRTFARRAVGTAAEHVAAAEHLALTLHGGNYGLDEVEAFEAEVAGLVDAITGGEASASLKRVSIVERDRRRAKRLERSLDQLVPDGTVAADMPEHVRALSSEAEQKLRSVGYASASRPHVFVAMPFADEMEDTYHYGINQAVRSAGLICERADTTSFTGDVLERVKERIRTARLVVADLTGANPNVYLEVGFAWGAGVPTVLLVDSSEKLLFDVRGQRCLEYRNIRDLEQKLQAELESLLELSDDASA